MAEEEKQPQPVKPEAVPKADDQQPAPDKKADAAAAPAAPKAAEEAAPKTGKSVRRGHGKHGRQVPVGIVHVKSTFNNTLVTITDPTGAVIAWSSAGRSGFKGSRKSTAYAATLVAQEAARAAMTLGLHEVEVRVQGPGAGRESAVRAIQGAGLQISAIKDVTPIPHNGCRPPKRRRV